MLFDALSYLFLKPLVWERLICILKILCLGISVRNIVYFLVQKWKFKQNRKGGQVLSLILTKSLAYRLFSVSNTLRRVLDLKKSKLILSLFRVIMRRIVLNFWVRLLSMKRRCDRPSIFRIPKILLLEHL